MDSQSNRNQKDITYLNSKPWYRFLKVLYILILGLTIGLSIPTALVFGWLQLILIAPIAVLFLLEIAKRSLYYIITGRVFPNRQREGFPSKTISIRKLLDSLQVEIHISTQNSVGVGFPNPSGEGTSPLRLGIYWRMADTPHINVNSIQGVLTFRCC